ncbi:hypothetical protein CONPUDRAFT_70754 [Coniophora puteana RWD-64-598 SS2]|uniref:Uncharacterized protein n=1 Tax=Coniophora puteana (strain RWD-64-598) TaxID=741705 RepID=A0A5M3MXC2_CONPW|nr:uncharacterized protein CONPUDRAFT_70754 [Coniophora puteana RWD-64-598 SS2]EIW83813.1 hypothetical protein CONPUDRAFT_70754 [Coniophora puteana RWD-64-598 SS2]
MGLAQSLRSLCKCFCQEQRNTAPIFADVERGSGNPTEERRLSAKLQSSGSEEWMRILHPDAGKASRRVGGTALILHCIDLRHSFHERRRPTESTSSTEIPAAGDGEVVPLDLSLVAKLVDKAIAWGLPASSRWKVEDDVELAGSI